MEKLLFYFKLKNGKTANRIQFVNLFIPKNCNVKLADNLNRYLYTVSFLLVLSPLKTAGSVLSCILKIIC